MGLERLNILLFLMQVTGLSLLGVTPNTKISVGQRSETKWYHPKNWWYVFIAFLHIVWTPLLVVFEFFHVFTFNAHESKIYFTVIIIWQISFTLSKLSPLLVLLHYKELQKVFEILSNVDRTLSKLSGNKTCSSRTRTVIGIVIGIAGMGATYGCAETIITKIYEKYGFALLLLVGCIEFVVKLQLITWYILFHLTYYNIAHRMNILKSLVLVNPVLSLQQSKIAAVFPLIDTATDVSKRIQKTGYLLDLLAAASNHLQHIFSFSALLILTTAFLSCTIGLFIFIHEVYQPSLFHDILYLELVLTISNVCVAVTIITSADLPCRQIRQLREHVMKLSTEPLDLDASTECSALLMSLSEDRFQLSAKGLFVVRKQLIPSLTGTVLTYLVILLQNSMRKKDPSSEVTGDLLN